MGIQTAFTSVDSPEAAARDIAAQLRADETRLIIYFSSSRYEPTRLAPAMHEALPHTPLIGCTSAGEITSGAMHKRSIAAMAISRDILEEVQVGVATNLGHGDPVGATLDKLCRALKTTPREVDPERFVGLVLIDGLSNQEEAVNDRIGELTNTFFVGGSAGDDLAFRATHVMVGAEAYQNAAVLALLKPARPFRIVKTQSFERYGKTLVANRVDVPNRTVLEFNGKPAAQMYAEALGVSVEELPKHFQSNPLGLSVGTDFYVRSPQQVKSGSVVFYCRILEGMELEVLRGTDIVSATQKAIQNSQEELGHLSAMINFHCILRTLELEQKGQCEAYGKLFANIPTLGFSTYGESYLGHINQTSTMLVFG